MNPCQTNVGGQEKEKYHTYKTTYTYAYPRNNEVYESFINMISLGTQSYRWQLMLYVYWD